MNRPALAIHVDLDGARQIFRAHGRAFSGDGDPIFASGMANMLRLFSDVGVRATLFVIAEDVRDPLKRSAIAEAAKGGHELASHTVTHPNLLLLNSTERRREIVESKAMIEDALGLPVSGFRAPGYSMDAESLRILSDSGYEYDSSVLPNAAFERRLARPRAELRRPQRFEEFGGIVELPLPGPAPLSFPIGPSFALAFRAWPLFHLMMARAAARGHSTVLLFHLIDFAAPLERAALGSARMSIFTLSTRSAAAKYRACQRMLRVVQRRFRLTATRELLAPFRRLGEGVPATAA